MSDPTSIPVIIGVADLRAGRAGEPVAEREPLELIAEAAGGALADSGVAGIGHRVDAIYAVNTACWAYADLPGLIAQRVGARKPRTWSSPIGGHWPAALLERIGSEIASGESQVALLVAGEAQASVTALAKLGVDPVSRGWTAAPGGQPAITLDDLSSPEMQRAGLFAPTLVYPLFENRFSHDLGHSPRQSRDYSAQIYARFSHLAAAHPCAWFPTVRTPAEIATGGEGNRLVSDAYPLLMNAMPFVDQAAAVLVCSLAVAREAGVAEDRIVYLWGGAGASDAPDVLARIAFGDSPALTSAVDRTMEQAGVNSADLGLIDAYSCFPVVPKLLIRALGLPDTTTPSVLGGHSFFGGPLNSYTLHAIAEVTRQLRSTADGRPALVHANGGFLTHQHTLLLANTQHPDGYVGDPTPQVLPTTAPPSDQPTAPTIAPTIVHGYVGTAEIVTATVTFDRHGDPQAGLVIASTPDGHRVAGQTHPGDAAALIRYTHEGSRSLVGARIEIADREGRFAVTLTEGVAA